MEQFPETMENEIVPDGEPGIELEDVDEIKSGKTDSRLIKEEGGLAALNKALDSDTEAGDGMQAEKAKKKRRCVIF